jgi:hypothetical protein
LRLTSSDDEHITIAGAHRAGGSVTGESELALARNDRGVTRCDEFVIKKGERFQMIEIHGDLGSCVWLEGFRDSQADVFMHARIWNRAVLGPTLGPTKT